MDPLWSFVFGNDHPVEIEIGPGRGDVLLAFAAARPEVNFFGIEHVQGTAERLTARLGAAGVTNARVIGGDATCVVRHLVPSASIARYHVYFPDPWPKRRHHRRRVFTEDFVAALRRSLVAGGSVHVATDLEWLYETIDAALVSGGFRRHRDAVAPPRPTTRFERKYASAGTYAGGYVVGSYPTAAWSVGAASPSPQKNS